MSTQTINKILRNIAPYIFFGLLLAGLMYIRSASAAGYLGEGWDKYLGGLRTFSASDKAGEDLAIDFVKNLIRIVRYLIGGVALIVAIVYGIKFVMAQGKEETITKTKTGLLWLIIGFIVLIIAENIAVLLQPGEAASGKMIEYDKANDQLRSIVSYLKYLFGFILLFAMLISGVKLVTSQGEEEKITQQKRNLTYSGIGMLVVLLADRIVNAFYVVKSPTEFAPGETAGAIAEVAGVIKLLLVFLGPVAVAVTILAGFYYLTAMDDEERAKKARSMIVAGITGIVFIYGALAITNTILKGQLTPS